MKRAHWYLLFTGTILIPLVVTFQNCNGMLPGLGQVSVGPDGKFQSVGGNPADVTAGGQTLRLVDANHVQPAESLDCIKVKKLFGRSGGLSSMVTGYFWGMVSNIWPWIEEGFDTALFEDGSYSSISSGGKTYLHKWYKSGQDYISESYVDSKLVIKMSFTPEGNGFFAKQLGPGSVLPAGVPDPALSARIWVGPGCREIKAENPGATLHLNFTLNHPLLDEFDGTADLKPGSPLGSPTGLASASHMNFHDGQASRELTETTTMAMGTSAQTVSVSHFQEQSSSPGCFNLTQTVNGQAGLGNQSFCLH